MRASRAQRAPCPRLRLKFRTARAEEDSGDLVMAMVNAVGSVQDRALEPAAAASRPVDAGAEAARKALDQEELQGREAVKLIKEAAQASGPPPARERGSRVDRTA
jgi:hypothetical protein